MTKKINEQIKEFKEEFNIFDFIKFLSIFILIGITPLITKVVFVDINPSEVYIQGASEGDVFVYAKSIVTMVIVTMFTIYLTLEFLINDTSFDDLSSKLKNPLVIGSSLIVIFTILSFILTPYKDVAFHGTYSRYESVFIAVGYVFIMAFVIHFAKNKFKIQLVLFSIYFATFCISIVSLSQVMGHSILEITFVKNMILGSAYKDVVTLELTTNAAFSTLFNPNYLGMYASIVFPLCFFGILMFPKNNVLKYLSLINTPLILFALISSGSRTGLITFLASIGVFYLILMFIFYKQNKIKNLKIMGVFLSILIIGIILIYLSVKPVNSYINSFVYKLFNVETYFTDITTNTDTNTVVISNNYESHIFNIDEDNNVVNVTNSNNDNLMTLPYNKSTEQKGNAQTNISDPFEVIIYGTQINYITHGTILSFEKINDLFWFQTFGEMLVDIEAPIDSFGFKGYETLGSNRGYIWSRSLPLLFDFRTFVFGMGNDSYTLLFPQQDVKGKLVYFSNPYIIVDKPHSMYIGYIISSGIFNLIGLMIISIYAIILGLKNIIITDNKFDFYILLALIISDISYLINGFAVDSNILVSPTFFAILGLLYSVNFKMSKTRGVF